MSIFKVLPYKMSSEGGRALARELSCRRLFNDHRSRYKWRSGHTIINWGNSILPTRLSNPLCQLSIINHPDAVKRATNKLLALQCFSAVDVPCPEWTTNVMDWSGQNINVFARTKLTSKCGDGIIIFNTQEDEVYPDAPLYTKHFKAKREYRVHVCITDRRSAHWESYDVIDFCKKGKRRERSSEPDPMVRSYENGWIFIRGGFDLPEEVSEAARRAVCALGLDFGAVDVGWRDGVACVYEVNSAPGFSEGSTPSIRYAEAFRRMYL